MRLIDADALMDKVNNTFAPFVTLLSDAPTVDAVEVVRCKDCKHIRHCGPGKAMCQNGKIHELDWYCADGERREQCD